MPDTAASYTLAALAGQGVANEMALTGRIYDAEWALGAGLVSRVVAPEDLLDEARSVARDVAANPPLAVRETKRLMWRHSPSWEEVVGLEDEAAAPLSGTEDQRESVRAFLESQGAGVQGAVGASNFTLTSILSHQGRGGPPERSSQPVASRRRGITSPTSSSTCLCRSSAGQDTLNTMSRAPASTYSISRSTQASTEPKTQ